MENRQVLASSDDPVELWPLLLSKVRCYSQRYAHKEMMKGADYAYPRTRPAGRVSVSCLTAPRDHSSSLRLQPRDKVTRLHTMHPTSLRPRRSFIEYLPLSIIHIVHLVSPTDKRSIGNDRIVYNQAKTLCSPRVSHPTPRLNQNHVHYIISDWIIIWLQAT